MPLDETNLNTCRLSDANVERICYQGNGRSKKKTREERYGHLPIITSRDYAAFQIPLRGHIPYAYEKWLKLHAMWHHHYSAERITIRSVNVSPHQFALHLKATGHPASLDELLAFAEITANEQTH
jgi:hypothetical protein